ncbi:MAG: SDR family oxidoreductase [Bdellovibrionota bacterium]
MSDSKRVVITGGSEGIGLALGKLLASEGHQIVLAARREPQLLEAAAGCGPNAIGIVTDVRDRAAVESLRDQTLARLGAIDVWVNNAGRGIGKRVLELTEADFDEMMSVNVKSALFGMQAIIPYFQSRGHGHLLNVSSFLGRVPLAPHRSAYSAAKAALNSLTANLRMDLRSTHPNVRVSLVMPGMVTTDFSKNALGGTPAVPPPQGPIQPQTAEQVAEAISELIRNPVPERFTNPLQVDVARRYCTDVAAFEAQL